MGDAHGLWILGFSVAALLVGPAVHRVAQREPLTMAALDNFVLVVVLGLVILEIVPAALHLSGLPAFVALLLGALGPVLADGPLHRAFRGTHSAALALAIVGMALHSFTDGLALASAHVSGGHSHALEAAVIAHQLPVAVAVWWLLSPFGLLRAAAAMLALGVATVAGFLLADHSLAALAPAWLGLLQALFAGFLLHVVAHRSDDRDRSSAPSFRVAAAVGGLAGVVMLAMLADHSLDGGHGHSDEPSARFLADLERLADHAAPVLLTALVLAVLALPIGRRLAHTGRYKSSPKNSPTGPADHSHAGSHAAHALEVSHVSGIGSGPVSGVSGAAYSQQGSLSDVSVTGGKRRLRPAPQLSFGEQLGRCAPWLAAGLLTAATIQPWLPASSLSLIPASLQVPLLALLGVPFHVFAPAAPPLIALLVGAGIGPGAALAFILSGPATALGAHRRRQGRKLGRTLMAVMLVVLIALGLVIDLRSPGLPPLAVDLAVLGLGLVLVAEMLRQSPQQFFRRLWHGGARPHHHPGDHSGNFPH